MDMDSIICNKITAALAPETLEVINESHLHAGHMDTSKNNTHFRLHIVSKEFEGVRAIKRHQMVYAVLADEMPSVIHALAMHLKAPSEIS